MTWIEKTISHYRIVSEIGRGGMGVVYRAEDTTLKRTVALKFLSARLLADENQKKRFLHEAQAAAALEHPNISTIHEISEADGHTFIVMAYIEGEDVRTKIEKGPMAVTEALDIAIQVAEGLSKAHSEGIVHRDVKPGNVIITNEGQAKVVDFGLAKLSTQTQLTRTGETVGTVRYMSPEQATGEAVDHRTDIWSLGAMLYEMLCGRLPFRGDVEQAILYSVLNEDPKPITEVRTEIPVALEDIIERALAKDPEKRYATMEEFLGDLERQRDQLKLGIREREFRGLRRLKRRKRLTVGVSAILIVAIAAVLTQTFYTRSVAIDSIAVLPFANLSGDPEQEYFSDGMTEQLINKMGQVGALRVISRTSVNQFKNTDMSLPEIAEVLRVDAIIEASVVRNGDKVRVTVQLIRANPEEVIWSESYNRDASNVMMLHSDVTSAIVERIQVTLTPEESERIAAARKVDPRAHDAYLKGVASFGFNEDMVMRALGYFQEATTIDPEHAPAYAGLANCYTFLSLISVMPHVEAAGKAKAAALKALELDPELATAHAALASTKFTLDWDWKGPDEHYRYALELSPNDPDIRTKYSFYLALVGRNDEAVSEAERSVELDPQNLFATIHLAWTYYYAERYDDAIATLRDVLAIAPGIYFPYIELAWNYARKGMPAEAIAACDSAFIFSAGTRDVVLLSECGKWYAVAGQLEKAQALLDSVLAMDTREYIDPVQIANMYNGLGDADAVFEWLERGYETRSGGMVFLKADFANLAGDPRFVALCKRVGFPVD